MHETQEVDGIQCLAGIGMGVRSSAGREPLGMSARNLGLSNHVVAAVTTRIGGVSKPPYDSANMALHVGDDPAAVLENRRRVCLELGIDPRDLVCAEQVHGNRVVAVREKDRGRGALSAEDALAGVDGMVTNVPGEPLAVFTADCVPISL